VHSAGAGREMTIPTGAQPLAAIADVDNDRWKGQDL